MLDKLPENYAPVIIKLLKGPIYFDDPHWECLQINETIIREYFAKIGIELYNDKNNNFAFIKQPKQIQIENKKVTLPRLTVSRQLTNKQTILCVLLREELKEFEYSEQIGKCLISWEKIRDLLTPYFSKYENDELKFTKEVDILVNHAINELGFLKKITGQEDQYEICRIILAKIDVETLEKFKQKMEKYKIC